MKFLAGKEYWSNKEYFADMIRKILDQLHGTTKGILHGKLKASQHSLNTRPRTFHVTLLYGIIFSISIEDATNNKQKNICGLFILIDGGMNN